MAGIPHMLTFCLFSPFLFRLKRGVCVCGGVISSPFALNRTKETPPSSVHVKKKWRELTLPFALNSTGRVILSPCLCQKHAEREIFTVPHKIWADLIRIFHFSLPAIASQTAQKLSDQICSDLNRTEWFWSDFEQITVQPFIYNYNVIYLLHIIVLLYLFKINVSVTQI